MDNNGCRSWLFVPGDRPDRYNKALASGADQVIVDLEDAVAAANKPTARRELAEWLNAERAIVVRINAADTEWFSDDIELCRRPGVAAVMLSKAESPDVLKQIDLPGEWIPLIETGLGFARMQTIASMPRVQRLAFGEFDFQHDLGMSARRDELLFFRSQFVLISRLASIGAPIDGPTQGLAEKDVKNAAAHAARLGFAGKLCIHPSQVQGVNLEFSPAKPDIRWAERVVATAEQQSNAAFLLDGQMIDRPVLLRAKALLQRARVIE